MHAFFVRFHLGSNLENWLSAEHGAMPSTTSLCRMEDFASSPNFNAEHLRRLLTGTGFDSPSVRPAGGRLAARRTQSDVWTAAPVVKRRHAAAGTLASLSEGTAEAHAQRSQCDSPLSEKRETLPRARDNSGNNDTFLHVDVFESPRCGSRNAVDRILRRKKVFERTGRRRTLQGALHSVAELFKGNYGSGGTNGGSKSSSALKSGTLNARRSESASTDIAAGGSSDAAQPSSSANNESDTIEEEMSSCFLSTDMSRANEKRSDGPVWQPKSSGGRPNCVRVPQPPPAISAKHVTANSKSVHNVAPTVYGSGVQYELSDDFRQRQADALGRKYGGYMRAHRAAIVIQRAYRQYRMNKRWCEVRAVHNHRHSQHYQQQQRGLASTRCATATGRLTNGTESPAAGSPTSGCVPPSMGPLRLHRYAPNPQLAANQVHRAPHPAVKDMQYRKASAPDVHKNKTEKTAESVAISAAMREHFWPPSAAAAVPQPAPSSTSRHARTVDMNAQRHRSMSHERNYHLRVRHQQQNILAKPAPKILSEKADVLQVYRPANFKESPGAIRRPLVLANDASLNSTAFDTTVGSNNESACSSNASMAESCYRKYADTDNYEAKTPLLAPAQRHNIVVSPMSDVCVQHRSPAGSSGSSASTNSLMTAGATPSPAVVWLPQHSAAPGRNEQLQHGDTWHASGASGHRAPARHVQAKETARRKPERGMELLMQHGFVEATAHAVAKFLLSRRGVSKHMIGEYLGTNAQFNRAVLECFADEIDVSGLSQPSNQSSPRQMWPIDEALRHFLSHFRLPGEAQKIERIMQAFARRWQNCVRGLGAQISFSDPDTGFVLAFAIVMLNTDLHSPNIKPDKRMKQADFIKNLRGIDNGGDIDPDLLAGIYSRVKAHQFRLAADHATQVAKVDRSIVGKKPCLSLPHRRLVCYCRLQEVNDARKRQAASVHNRDVFLFNDLIVITKCTSGGGMSGGKSSGATYTFRQSHSLVGMQADAFKSQYYEHGLRLHSTLDDKMILFNAKNGDDQRKFLDDLRESILESDEMESLRINLELERQAGGAAMRTIGTVPLMPPITVHEHTAGSSTDGTAPLPAQRDSGLPDLDAATPGTGVRGDEVDDATLTRRNERELQSESSTLRHSARALSNSMLELCGKSVVEVADSAAPSYSARATAHAAGQQQRANGHAGGGAEAGGERRASVNSFDSGMSSTASVASRDTSPKTSQQSTEPTTPRAKHSNASAPAGSK